MVGEFFIYYSNFIRQERSSERYNQKKRGTAQSVVPLKITDYQMFSLIQAMSSFKQATLSLGSL